MATSRVRDAIAASPSALAPDLPLPLTLRDGTLCKLVLLNTSSLSSKLQDAIYALFDVNMSEVSVFKGTSMVYTKSSKPIELFDPSAFYLLLLRSPSSTRSPSSDTVPMPGALPPNSKGKGKALVGIDDPSELLGYCSFRFDTEETLGSQDAEVIYCYELQLSAVARRQGLAKKLMDRLEKIGREREMSKAMLTCLKGNATALQFYDAQGYQADEIDPTRMAEEESEDEEDWEEVGSDGEPLDRTVDYTILSKNLTR